MCRSSATLFYGTFVKAIPLFLAADAWPHLKPAFTALDLINSRRAEGTLRFEEEVEGRGNVGKLPIEVLELVKQQLVDLEMEEARARMKIEFGCEGATFAYADEDPAPCDFPNSLNHGECWSEWHNDGGMVELAVKFDQRVSALLGDFKLCRPTTKMLSSEEPAQGDLDTITPLSLPLHSSTSSAFPAVHARRTGQAEYEDAHAVAKLDPSALVLPPDAHRRFQRFLSLFRLDTFDPTSSSILPSPSTDFKSRPWTYKTMKADEQAERKGKELKQNERVSLGWHVWAYLPPCEY